MDKTVGEDQLPLRGSEAYNILLGKEVLSCQTVAAFPSGSYATNGLKLFPTVEIGTGVVQFCPKGFVAEKIVLVLSNQTVIASPQD